MQTYDELKFLKNELLTFKNYNRRKSLAGDAASEVKST